jgi:sulfur-carrier protein
MPLVRIPTPLRTHAGGKDAVEAPGATVGEVLHNLAEAHPELGKRILENGEVRGFVNVYLNDEDIRFLDELATKIGDKDEISIIPAIAGG